MDFDKVLKLAAKNERKVQKETVAPTALLRTKFSAPKKETKTIKGDAVRAFLEKKEKEEREKALRDQKSKEELLLCRKDARHDRKARAMASRTKDNLKLFDGFEEKKNVVPDQLPISQAEAEVDLKHLFTKHDRRVARLPSGNFPNMLDALKEREKQRQLAKEEAEKEKEKLQQREKEQEERRRQRTAADEKMRGLGITVQPAPSSSASQFKIPRKSKPPPPMSFDQLIALAEKKQAGAVNEVGKVANDQSSVPGESGRLMTQEEKERIERRQTKEYQDWLNNGGPPPPSFSASKKNHSKKKLETTDLEDLPCSGNRAVVKLANERVVAPINTKTESMRNGYRDSPKRDSHSSSSSAVRGESSKNSFSNSKRSSNNLSKNVSGVSHSQDVSRKTSSS